MVGVGWSRIVGDAKPLGRPLELQEHLVCDRWDYMPGENADGALFVSRGTLFDSRVVTLFESALAAARSNSRDAICDWARALDF